MHLSDENNQKRSNGLIILASTDYFDITELVVVLTMNASVCLVRYVRCRCVSSCF